MGLRDSRKRAAACAAAITVSLWEAVAQWKAHPRSQRPHQKTKTAFPQGLIGDLLFRRYIEGGASFLWAFQLLPSFSLYRGLLELAGYAELAINRSSPGGGLSFAKLSDPGCGMTEVWAMLAGEWAVMLAVAWYLEQVCARAARA